MAKTSAIIELTLIPIRRTVLMSNALARIAIPCFVWCKNRKSAIRKISVTSGTMSVMVVKLIPKSVMGWTKNSGALKNLGVEPKNTLNTFSKKNRLIKQIAMECQKN